MPNHPNILFVIMDSVRPEWLSCTGAPVTTSPNIDALAARGIVFERAIAPSAWTFPAMASVFTGMLPTQHGGHDEHLFLDSHYPTMAEILQRNGYDTAAIADVPYVGPMTRLDRGFGLMSNLRREQVALAHQMLKGIGRVHRNMVRTYRKTFETRVVIGESLRWLERTWDRSRPFFLYIHSDETHAPFLPPARFRRTVAGLSARRMYAINQNKQLFVGGKVRMTEADFDDLRKLARAELAFFDAALGRVTDYLARRDLLDETIIVIAADHGDNMGEHGLIRHGLCLYDTLLHVPLIIRLPGGRNAGRVTPMVRTIDVLPTLMRAAAIEEPYTRDAFQGCDLLECMDTGRFPEYSVSELYRPAIGIWEKTVPEFMPRFRDRYDRVLRAYRTNTHKFIWSSNDRHELYHLVNDPGEEHNLIDQEPALATQFMERLEAWLRSFPHASSNGPTDDVAVEDDRIMERLRDLGYVE